nr:sigma 54-interacting transcriptional regulator [uncultured Desulfobacter sp.]
MHGPDENLLEAELLGYERGAFTGTRQQGKAGFIELAHGGVLFLDEIGDMPLSVQAGVYDAYVEKLSAAAQDLKTGPGDQEGKVPSTDWTITLRSNIFVWSG